MEPLTLYIDGSLAKVEHHNHEDKKDHDGAGVDDHFERCDEWRAKHKKHDGYSKQGDREVE